MTSHRIDSNSSFVTEVTVRESDRYTQMVNVRFDRSYVTEDVRGCSEMFMTPNQLEALGRFMIRQADEIRQHQSHREVR